MRITKRDIALKNIQQKRTRSFGLIALIAVFAFVLLLATLILISLNRGVSSLSDRLGADVMIIPESNQGDIEDLLLRGVASEYYLPDDVLEILSNVEGIEKVSPQTFIATLDASCCSAKMQIIGFDQQTDFVIKPWLNRTITRDLAVGEVIAGHGVYGDVGDTIYFFDKPYTIAGKLEATGMGFDDTVFVNFDTARLISADAQQKKSQNFSNNDKLISAVMIKLKSGYDPIVTAQGITYKYAKQGIFAKFSKQFVGNVAMQLNNITQFAMIVIVAIWIFSAFVISVVFKVVINERKKEFAVFRIIGATKKYLSHLVLTEVCIISFIGACLGILLALIFGLLYGQIIARAFQIPYLLPSAKEIILWSSCSFLLSFLMAPIASLFGLISLSKWDINIQFRENE